ncbi:hypothetical protein P4O66_002765 [Electrophorus voltai]|uniref:Uncharacterized protein n=1 Tax=Electrophorus voltai TaxID=2609070 RepID=A0AAD9DNV8_9TELE|nr:hypothetical protein P4O66_002765 [Electrophorus voltai]
MFIYTQNLFIISPCSPSLTPLAAHHHLQFLQQQLLQQQQQAQVAVAQSVAVVRRRWEQVAKMKDCSVKPQHKEVIVSPPQVQLLQDQLAAETAARMEAQARSHQLLLQNRDLLQHVALLVKHVGELEARVNSTAHYEESPWRSSSAHSLSPNLKNSHIPRSDQPITSTPEGETDTSPATTHAVDCTESYLSLLKLGGSHIATANGKLENTASEEGLDEGRGIISRLNSATPDERLASSCFL